MTELYSGANGMIYKIHMEMTLPSVTPKQNGGELLTLSRIEHPEYKDYRYLHDKVGAPYGWDKRARIRDVATITELLSSDKVELWRFFNGTVLIGYSLFTCAEDNTAELEDFGFFPEHCGVGHGGFFLQAILERMAARGVQKVWLTTRSTNHPKVVSFYGKMGFQFIDRVLLSNEA